MTQETKTQHYVPRFYLKNFSVEGKDSQVYCLDKKEENIFPCSINGIAAEKYFYEKGDSDQSVEKELSKLENKVSNGIKQLKKEKNPIVLSEENRQLISAFSALQVIRTRESRNLMKSLNRSIKQSLRRDYSGIAEPLKSVLEMDENKARKSQLRMFQFVPEFMRIISQKKWVSIINKTKVPYWTSDHPIYRYNPRDNDDRLVSMMGLASRGIQIFLPITPDLTLGMIDSKDYSHLGSVLKTRNRKNIYFANSIQVGSSNRFLISSEKDFSLAKKVLSEKPRYKDPDRRRTGIR